MFFFLKETSMNYWAFLKEHGNSPIEKLLSLILCSTESPAALHLNVWGAVGEQNTAQHHPEHKRETESQDQALNFLLAFTMFLAASVCRTGRFCMFILSHLLCYLQETHKSAGSSLRKDSEYVNKAISKSKDAAEDCDHHSDWGVHKILHILINVLT